MNAKQVSSGPIVTWVAVLDDGNELMSEISPWIGTEGVAAASITGVEASGKPRSPTLPPIHTATRKSLSTSRWNS